jgi:(E)-4-hydroxy-3-methylbut-2-enyl-diphosphate synthase
MLGGVPIGGDAPVVVQSMASTDTRDVRATVAQIQELENWGCEIVRVAVPDAEAAAQLSAIKAGITIPLVADIHFDYRLALQALQAGVDGLRLNPGNLREPDKVRQVVAAAKERETPIRIGVNAGSLPEPMADDQRSIAQRMVDLATEQVRWLEALDFNLIKLSLKAFDVPVTVEAYRLMAQSVCYPLHLGITEAGTPRTGEIRSAVGLGILLSEGIGDTIRVSLTAHPREEVRVGWEILKSLNLRQRGPTLVSCPTCGRTEIDLLGLAQQVDDALQQITAPIKVAVMGCVVNGPGEARDADVGIAGGKGKGVVFRQGQVIGAVDEAGLFSALMGEVNRFLADRPKD